MKLVAYEWIVEEIDQYGDILDINYFDTHEKAFQMIAREPPDSLNHYDIGVVRDRFHPEDPNELVDRQWAYLDNGKLPTHFDGGALVPAFLRK